MFSVVSGGLTGAQIYGVVHGGAKEEAGLLKRWIVLCHVAVSLVWVHACVAWYVVGERVLGDVADGGWVTRGVILGVVGGLL